MASSARKEPVLTKSLSNELADNVGKVLLEELEKQSVKEKVDKAISTFVNEKKLGEKPAELSKRLEWSVKVSLKSRA